MKYSFLNACKLPSAVSACMVFGHKVSVWGGDTGELGRSRDGCIRWGGDRRRVMGSFGGECGRPTVTNGAFVA